MQEDIHISWNETLKEDIWFNNAMLMIRTIKKTDNMKSRRQTLKALRFICRTHSGFDILWNI